MPGRAKTATQKGLPGRPTLYREKAHCKSVYQMALLGLSEKRMAEIIGISEAVFKDWKARHHEFSSSLARGKEPADAEVAVALRDRALGYSHRAVKLVVTDETDEDGNKRKVVMRVPYVEHFPPDTAAASLWLRNRQPALWKDKHEVAVGGVPGSPVETKTTIDATEAAKEYAKLMGGE